MSGLARRLARDDPPTRRSTITAVTATTLTVDGVTLTFPGGWAPSVGDIVVWSPTRGRPHLVTYIPAAALSVAVTITSANWANYGGGEHDLTVTRSGNIAILTGLIKTAATPTSFETIGTIPAAYRPAVRIISMGLDVSTAVRRVEVTAGGAFRVEGTATTTLLAANMVWPVG